MTGAAIDSSVGFPILFGIGLSEAACDYIIGVHAPEALALGYLDFTPQVAIGQTKIFALSFASNLSSHRPENLAGYYMKWLGQVTKKDCQQRNGWKESHDPAERDSLNPVYYPGV